MESTIRVKVNDQEKNLILLIQWIGYGEVLDVTIGETEANSELLVGPSIKKLIDTIREGNQHFERIQVHQNEPQYAEVSGELFGFRYRRRYKFV